MRNVSDRLNTTQFNDIPHPSCTSHMVSSDPYVYWARGAGQKRVELLYYRFYMLRFFVYNTLADDSWRD